jgi:hypothetical protein
MDDFLFILLRVWDNEGWDRADSQEGMLSPPWYHDSRLLNGRNISPSYRELMIGDIPYWIWLD